MADWVVDKGLDKLLSQINAAAPGRNKSSDGSIGDAAHQSRDSDHNPESPPPPGNPDNQVDARDFTHDPAHNADMGIVTESIRQSRDRRVSYVIFNRRIFSSYVSTGGRPAWTWGPYSGSDPHTGHAHVSVNDGNHDQTQDWKIGIDTMATNEVDLSRHGWAVPADINGRGAGTQMDDLWYEEMFGHGPYSKDKSARQQLLEKTDIQAAANGSALSQLKTEVEELKQMIAALTVTGGMDPAAMTQLVQDAVRTELNATRLAAG